MKINAKMKPGIIFSSPKVEALYLTLNQGFFRIDKKIKLIAKVPELYKNFSKRVMLKEIIAFYENKQKEMIKKIEGIDMTDINKLFAPSKTAQNGLNFITNDEFQNLISKEQPNEVILLFTIILIKDANLLNSNSN